LKKQKIVLEYGEKIVAVVPEYCEGPGWVNTVLWVYIANIGARTFRFECYQPEEQNDVQRTLFSIGAQVNKQLVASVEVKQKKPQ
jgi:hypothetical protein